MTIRPPILVSLRLLGSSHFLSQCSLCLGFQISWPHQRSGLTLFYCYIMSLHSLSPSLLYSPPQTFLPIPYNLSHNGTSHSTSCWVFAILGDKWAASMPLPQSPHRGMPPTHSRSCSKRFSFVTSLVHGRPFWVPAGQMELLTWRTVSQGYHGPTGELKDPQGGGPSSTHIEYHLLVHSSRMVILDLDRTKVENISLTFSTSHYYIFWK